MHWMVANLLMFASSVALYLLIRRAALNKLPVHFNNLANFSVPLVIFSAAAIITRPSFSVSVADMVILLLTGVFLSYLSSKFSLKSIELAPNPGYSLVISKSYVVFTTFLAVPLFGARLSWQAIIAISCIVGFSALIMFSTGKTRHLKGAAWLPLALLAFFGWGFLSLVAKYLFSHGMDPIVFLIYIEAIVVICILVEMRSKNMQFGKIGEHIGSFILIGLGAASFNFFHFSAISLAPNVGYVNATNAASIAAVTVFAIVLFGDEFSWRKMIGVFGVVGGLVLLFLGH